VRVRLVAAVAALGMGFTAEAASAAHTFPVLRMVEPPVAFDSLDPAVAYAVGSWRLEWRVYLGLLTYESRSGAAGTVLVPALAQSLPRISDGGRRYLFQLRPGLRYSNGLPVRASDIKYAIERLFRINSPGVGFFGDIVGAASSRKHGGPSRQE
jgi:ABC-type transport system substrate-binding protein